MPRSSFSDNPLLRVSRPVSACSRCRAAKVKCDGKLPACTACEKAGRENECSAANDQFARGKERSYVAALELRIEKLTKRLQYAESRKASVASHINDAPPVHEPDRKDSLATIKAAIHRKAARNRENSDVNALISDFGQLSVNATTRDFGAASNMTFARLVLAASTNVPLPKLSPTGLPPRQAAQGIIDYYIEHIHSLYPFFPEVAVFSALDNIYKQDQKTMRGADYWLFYMVLAIGSIAQSRSSLDEFYLNGIQFVSRALDHADRALAPGYTTLVQSLLLLTQYSMFDPAHFDSWQLIGITCRAVVDLGFHQDPPRTQLADRPMLDMRRKMFYSVYALDRAISMVHARAFSFTDDAINVEFPSMSGMGRIPSASGPIDGPQSANPAILLFQLRRIQSHWYQALYESDPSEPLPSDPTSYIWQMCHDLREWSEALPETLPIGIRELFDLELKYSYVYCIAPSPRAPQMTPYGRLLIFEYAISYVDRISELARGSTTNPALYTYHDALRVFFMGNQFLSVLRDDAETLLASSSIPMPLSLPETAPPPTLPPDSRGDSLDRGIRCIERVRMTLHRYGERWEDAKSLADTWDIISAEVASMLAARKGMRDHMRFQSQSPPGMIPGQQSMLARPQMSPPQMAGLARPHMSPPQMMGPGQARAQQMSPPQMMGPGQARAQMSSPQMAGPGQGRPQMPPSQMVGPGQMMPGPGPGPRQSPGPGQGGGQEVQWVDMNIQQMMRDGGV